MRHPHCASVKYTYSDHHLIQHNFKIFRLLVLDLQWSIIRPIHYQEPYKNSRQTYLIVHTQKYESVNVYVTLTRYRHRNTKQASSQSYINKPQYPSETNRKRMNTISEKFTECCTNVRIVMSIGLTHLHINWWFQCCENTRLKCAYVSV